MNLNLPEFEFRFSEKDGKKYIFDEIRKTHIILTPEEWVRQNFVKFLIQKKKYPASLIKIEKGLKVNNTYKRTDIVICNSLGMPLLIVECKAPSVKITQDVFNQIANYNIALQTTFLVVTNGLQHYCCRINFTKHEFTFIEDIPLWDEINTIKKAGN